MRALFALTVLFGYACFFENCKYVFFGLVQKGSRTKNINNLAALALRRSCVIKFQ